MVSRSVREIEFSWTWDTALLIVADATLTIKGVSIHLNIIKENHETAETPPSAYTSGEEDAAMNSDWKARYLQQIIDHLTLVIEVIWTRVHRSSCKQKISNSRP
jgi:hypothetical protein